MKRLLLAALISAGALSAQSDPGAGSIEGQVINLLTSAPVRRATVTLTASEVRLVADTDAAGKFQFSALPPGTYRLSAMRSGFLERPFRRVVTVGQGEQVRGAEIRLSPQGTLSGHILDEEGEPVDRARVWMYKQVYQYGRKLWDRLNISLETDDSGAYRFSNLAQGRYLVQAFSQRPQVSNRYGDPPVKFYVPVYYPNASSEQQAVPVSVGPGVDVRGIDVHLFKLTRPPAVRVRGKVTGIPRDSQIIVSMGLTRADGGFFGGTSTQVTPPDYAFDLRVPPGQYRISGNVYSGGSEAYGSGNLSVTGDIEGAVLVMSPAPEITGRISLAEKDTAAKLQDVRVVLQGLSSVLATGVFELKSNESGNLGPFPNIVRRPGHFAVVAVRSIPAGYFVREVKLAGQEISPDDFEVVSSAPLEIILDHTAARIAGSVTDASGKPFPGSTVTLISADGKSRPAKQSVDDSGNFQFNNLRPGKYSLYAWEEADDDLWPDPEFRKKYENRAVEITAAPSETQNVQLRAIALDEVK